MTRPSWIWRETAEVLGVVGIIAGIIFLGFELRQNNELLEAEARYNHMQARSGVMGQLHQNAGLAAIIAKGRENQPLTSAEQTQLEYFYFDMFVAWEWEFREGEEGSLEVPVWAYRESFRNFPDTQIPASPGQAEAWEKYKVFFSVAFVEFIDQEVLGYERE